MVAMLVALCVGFAYFLIRVVIAALAAAGVYFFLQWIVVPAFLSASTATLGSLDPSILYFANIADLQFGLSVISAAYVTRFVIRRFSIPL